MAFALVVAVYGASALLALLLLYIFHPKAWYWHVLSVLLALVIGLIPFPEGWHSPVADLVVGAIFIFFFLWGVCAPLYGHRSGSRQAHQT